MEPLGSSHGRTAQDHLVQSHFQDGKAGQRGKETCPRAPSRCLGTLEVAPSPPPSGPTFLCHLHHTPPTPLHHRGCSSFSLPLSILLPALPRPACRLTSPLVCSPIAASAFFSRPLEPGASLHPLFGQCFLLSPGPSQLVLGLLLGWACPFPSTSSLPRGAERKDKLLNRRHEFSPGFGIGWAGAGRCF